MKRASATPEEKTPVNDSAIAPHDLGRGGRALVIMAALTIFLTGLKLAAPIIVPLLLAIFVATASSPVIPWLRRFGVPRVLGVVVAFCIDLAALFLFGVLVAASLNALYYRMPQYQERLAEVMNSFSGQLSLFGYELTSEVVRDLVDPGRMFELVSVMLRSAAGVVSNLVLVLLLIVFMLLEASGLRDKLHRIIQNPDEDLGAFATTAREMQKYLVVKTASSLLTAVLVGIWLIMLDVELPLLWGLLAFALNFIPTIGSIIAAVPPMMVSLLMHGIGDSMMLLAGYIAVNFTIGNFLEPRVLGRTLGLSPLIIVISVVFWGWLLGPIGALLAVPLTMVAKIFLVHTEDLRWLAILLGPSSESLLAPLRESSVEGSSPRATDPEAESATLEGPFG